MQWRCPSRLLLLQPQPVPHSASTVQVRAQLPLVRHSVPAPQAVPVFAVHTPPKHAKQGPPHSVPSARGWHLPRLQRFLPDFV